MWATLNVLLRLWTQALIYTFIVVFCTHCFIGVSNSLCTHRKLHLCMHLAIEFT